MKKLFSLITLLALVAFVGCENKGGDEGITSFSLAQTELEVSADGGAQSIAYTIKNPQSGAVVLTNCSENWIKELSTATVGEIKFTVMPNYTSETREATIAVQYTAVEEKFEIKVKQAASEKPMFAFEVVANEPTRLSINVTPADLSTAYICRAYTEAHIDVNNLYLDEFLAEYDMEAIEYEAYYAGQTLLNYLQNISHTGKGFDIEFNKLTPDTNYVVYAYHIDQNTGEIFSDIHR
ncbi:MAG: BACON domain-containing protein, partial [Alistipes sp.]|nr:BACON domain-containing protein [Alistipes sp.]